MGPAHVMTMLNSEVRVQNKTGGIIGTVSLDTSWTAGTGLSGNPFDPRMHYDAIHGRWIATVDVNQQSTFSEVWFAISDTSDPTGGWSFYAFDADPTNQSWADFPGFGYNATWITITNNMFPVSGGGLFDGAKMWVIDAASALAGGPLTVTVFPKFFDAVTSFFSFTLHPAVTFGSEPKLYLVDLAPLAGGLIRMSEISGTGPAPVWSPTSGSLIPGSGLFPPENQFDYDIPGAEQLGVPSTCLGGSFDGLPCRTALNCAGSACRRIDTGDVQMSATPVFRNGRLWITHAGGLPVGSVDRNAVFWYELDPALMASSGAPIAQSGIIQGPPGSYLFYPSIAVNAVDDVAIGFSRSDAGRYAEAAAATRAGGSPAGTFGAIVQLKAGEDSYLETFGSDRNRWGDYSATVVDPADDTTFWTIQEYAGVANSWATWWAKLEVVVTCGDGIREGSEECDDGNTLSGDCCSSTCQAEAAGAPCGADGNVCTDDVCDGSGACGVPNTLPCDDGSACTDPDACSGGTCGGTPQPRGGCHSPGRSLLLVKNDAGDDTKDKLVWKWLKGSMPASELGNPSTTTNYTLCIYAGATPALLTPPLDLPAGPGTWTPIDTVGWSYADDTNPDGLRKGTFRSSLTGKAKIIVKGKGTSLPDPTLSPAPPVTVQLVNDTPGACWEARFAAGDVLKATSSLFKAKR